MCNFFSAVIANKGKNILWLKDSASHSDILEHYKIKDDDLTPDFVKVEFTPPAYTEKVFKDLSSWELRLDQDNWPEWFLGIDYYRAVIEAEVNKFIQERVFFDGHHEVEEGQVILFGSSSAELHGSSSAELSDSSSAKLYGSSSAELYDSSSAGLWNSSLAIRPDTQTAIIPTGWKVEHHV